MSGNTILSVADAMAIWNAYRGKIVAEDNLINHRMSWMLWSEAILYAMWGALIAASTSAASLSNATFSANVKFTAIHIAMFSVSVIGVFVGYWSKSSIKAAKDEIKYVKNEYQKNHPEMYHKESFYPFIYASKEEHLRGHAASDWLPTCFIVMQFFTAIYGLVIFSSNILGKM